MLYIVTPCSRPQNLVRLKQGIPPYATWVVMMDASTNYKGATSASITHYSNRTGDWGHPLRNEFLELYADSFTKEDVNEDLRQWFKQKWVRMDTKGNIKGDCAREPGEGKPKCLPAAKAHSLGKEGRASAARRNCCRIWSYTTTS